MSIEKSDGLLIARERILEVKNSMGTGHEITTLELSGLRLKYIPNEITVLTGLKKLDLSFNTISKIENLEKLSSIESLNISRNRITEIKNLEQLNNLSSLYLSKNNITEIKNLEKLQNLYFLDLSINNITEIKNLDKLKNLISLNLKSNRIIKINNLDHLANLEYLRLSSNLIENIENLEQLVALKILSLNRNKITEIKNLDKLTSLQNLDLSLNEIFEIKNLEQLGSLEDLYLYGNKITEIKNLDKLENLKDLNLSSNKISEIQNIDKLYNLQNLELNSNQITVIENLEQLVNLKNLSLNRNQITEIRNLDKPYNLQNLELNSNQITVIENLEQLINLKDLSLNRNQITDIKNLDKLFNLQNLDLSYNKISEIKNLENLNELKYLNLNSNQILEIKNLEKNNSIYKLNLANNRIKQLPETFNELNYLVDDIYIEKGVSLYNNPLSEQLALAIKSGKQAIQDYFFNLNQGEVPLREAKLMILGESEAGKTNLRNYLMAKPFNDKQSATIGIKIDHWKLKKQDQEYRINIWDFGGQWMQEQVHRFFITESCVYVLMIDARKGTSPVEWLDWILSHGKNSKVILVANRMDDLNDQSFEFKTNELKNKYPDLIHSFHYISLKKVSESVEAAKQNLFHLHDSILNCIFSLANIEENVSANIFSLKKKLEDEVFASKPYISHDYFNELAKDIRISDGGHYILTLYNRLGTIRYIDTQSKYILNPEWLSSGIYRLIVSERTQQLKGILTLENFKQILQKTDEYTQEYDPKHDYPFLMDLMEEFKLAYISPNRKKVFIPKQFNQDIPIYIKEDEMFRSDYIHYYFDYEAYFPDSLISQFIASMFGEVDGENYWREGIILKDNEDSSGSTLALISSNSYTNRITIKLKGSDIFRQAYFVKIRSELIKLQKDLNYKYTEYVVDSEHQLAISYKKLITFLNNGEREIKEDKDGRIVNIDILKILGYIENNKATMSNLYIQNNFAFVQFHYQDTLNEQLKNVESLLSQLSDKEDIETLKKIIDDLKSSLNQSDPKEDKSIFEKVMEDIKNFPELMKSEGMKIIAKEILFTAYRNLNSMHSSLLKILESGLNTGNFIN